VEPSSPSPTHDRELDLGPPAARPSGNDWPPWVPQQYQRLVANPFLALLGLIVWFAALRWALTARNLWLVGLAVLGLAAVAYLLQYHCLDCGSTGHLFHWKSHACERVRTRQQSGRIRRFRGPNPVFQTVLWGYLLAALAILVGVVVMALR
jgi:hypothetical protein